MYMVLTNLEQCVGNIVYIYKKKINFTESKYIKNANKKQMFSMCSLFRVFQRYHDVAYLSIFQHDSLFDMYLYNGFVETRA